MCLLLRPNPLNLRRVPSTVDDREQGSPVITVTLPFRRINYSRQSTFENSPIIVRRVLEEVKRRKTEAYMLQAVARPKHALYLVYNQQDIDKVGGIEGYCILLVEYKQLISTCSYPPPRDN